MSTLSCQQGRPRERLLGHSAAVLTNAELLGIILRTGRPGRDAVQLGQQLLDHFEGLHGLLAAEASALKQVAGVGNAKACEILAIAELHRRVALDAMQKRTLLNQPKLVKDYCIAQLGSLPVEHCLALYLNTQFQLITAEEVSRGTLNQASVYPREIARAALRHHAAALILAHNHPSGTTTPSQADLRLTQHLKQALALIDVQLLDHLVITRHSAYSLAEHGQL